MPLADIGKAWSVTRERVRQIEEGLYDKVIGILTVGSRRASLSRSSDREAGLRVQRAIWQVMDERERKWVRRRLRATRLVL